MATDNTVNVRTYIYTKVPLQNKYLFRVKIKNKKITHQHEEYYFIGIIIAYFPIILRNTVHFHNDENTDTFSFEKLLQTFLIQVPVRRYCK